MKYTICGFQQTKLIEYGLDVNDAHILRWFVDIGNATIKYRKIVDDKEYRWVNYEKVLDELPILGIKKRALANRMQKMVNSGILEHTTVRDGGTYSYYRLGEKYMALVEYDHEGGCSNDKGGHSNDETCTPQQPPPSSVEQPTNDPSTQDNPSIQLFSSSPDPPVVNDKNPDQVLKQKIEKAFLSKSEDGKFTDYQIERKNIKTLIARAKTRAPDDPEGFIKILISAFWNKKNTSDAEFWKLRPFTPSGLNGVFDQIIEYAKVLQQRKQEPEENTFSEELKRVLAEAPV